MSDSGEPDAVDMKHERNREQRVQALKRWVESNREHLTKVWVKQQNRLVNSQKRNRDGP